MDGAWGSVFLKLPRCLSRAIGAEDYCSRDFLFALTEDMEIVLKSVMDLEMDKNEITIGGGCKISCPS